MSKDNDKHKPVTEAELAEALARFPDGIKLERRRHLSHDASEEALKGLRVGHWPHVANFAREEDAEALVVLVNAMPRLLAEVERLTHALERTQVRSDEHAEALGRQRFEVVRLQAENVRIRSLHGKCERCENFLYCKGCD